ncbi:unnamed protein product [Paramecium pentaurelia]|uniref:Uncharacterized protein n=1 Tax=Paramecium pentaurelia TaxID=43138 RepID=A0A8S1VY16_9CILI|nr:unnamed protein product [Paramecium pentaurelia]
MQGKQTQDSLETICKIHNLEFIDVDLDMSDKLQIQFFCGKCLVDKLNNNKVTTIEQSKERIQKIKTQQQEIKTKENQSRLNYLLMILKKRCIKKYNNIYIFPIQKEKSELHEQYFQLNYFEDIKQLQEYNSDNYLISSKKLIEDNNFIDDVTRQFELLFNYAKYFQTLDIFEKTKQIIEDLMENNILQLPPLFFTKNESKTPSLNRICPNHKTEIIMIDMDSQNKKIEDRFACDCIAENPQIKYSIIESLINNGEITIQNQIKCYQSINRKAKIKNLIYTNQQLR